VPVESKLVKNEMVAVRFEGESGGKSENEWQPLPDSGRRSKDMARYKTRKKERSTSRECSTGK